MDKEEALLMRAHLKIFAMREISEVMYQAEVGGAHEAGSWTLEGMQHHLGHAMDHIFMARDTSPYETKEERDAQRLEITHALTRCAMALWSFDHGILGDMGTEGKGT